MTEQAIRQYEHRVRLQFLRDCINGNYERAIQQFELGMKLVKQYKRLMNTQPVYPHFKEVYE